MIVEHAHSKGLFLYKDLTESGDGQWADIVFLKLKERKSSFAKTDQSHFLKHWAKSSLYTALH